MEEEYRLRCSCGVMAASFISKVWPSKELPHGGTMAKAIKIVRGNARAKCIAAWNKRSPWRT